MCFLSELGSPAIQPDRLSPVSLIEHPEARATCVVFAGWSGARGYFLTIILRSVLRSMRKSPDPQDPSMKWFTSGLKSFGSSIEETSSSLQDTIPIVQETNNLSGIVCFWFSCIALLCSVEAQAVMALLVFVLQ